MRQRWLPVGLVAAGVFAVNAVARIAVRLFAAKDADAQTTIGLVALGVVAALLAAAGYRWAVRHPAGRLALDLGVAVLAGFVASVVLGPLLVGAVPFAEGTDLLVGEVWQFLLISAGAVGFGLLVAMALGRDWKSQAWKRYEESRRSKPRRVVRR
jgi:MFS family permease